MKRTLSPTLALAVLAVAILVWHAPCPFARVASIPSQFSTPLSGLMPADGYQAAAVVRVLGVALPEGVAVEQAVYTGGRETTLHAKLVGNGPAVEKLLASLPPSTREESPGDVSVSDPALDWFQLPADQCAARIYRITEPGFDLYVSKPLGARVTVLLTSFGRP
ncbi:MAG: hypothetical protein U0836_07545 [Pirellulales bacterium]